MSFLFSQPAPGILPANSVDFSEVETIAANTLLGNNTGSDSVIQELSTANVATMLNLAQYLTSVSGSAPISSSGGTTPTISISQSSAVSNGYLSSTDWSTFNNKQPAGNYITALTGEVTAAGPGSVSATIANSAVTNAKLANMANNTIKGNISGVAAAPSDLSATQVTAFLNPFTSLLQGVVPASGGGTSNFLRADGTWAAAGVNTAGALDQQVLAYDSGTGLTTWQYAGLGDGNLGTNNVIIGRSKPSALTGTNNVLIGPNSGGTISSANDCFLVGVPIQWHDFSGEINIQNRVRISPSLNSVSLGSGTISNNSVSISANQALRGVSILGASGVNGVTIGYSCGGSDYAVCIGGYAGQFGISQKSVAVGHEAHKFGSASVEGFNVATGFQSLLNAGTGQYNVAIGNQTLYNTNSKNSCVGIGSFAGYNANTANEFYLDSRSSALASNALEKTNSLMYGQFNATPTSQTLRINAQVNLVHGEKHASVHAQTGTANVITATVNNYYIGVDCSGAAKTVNLPAAATAGQGFILVIKDESNSAATNNITLQASGAETIDGTNTKLIAANYGSYSLMCSGSAWFIM